MNKSVNFKKETFLKQKTKIRETIEELQKYETMA